LVALDRQPLTVAAMAAITRIAIIMYLFQAAAGFAAGLTVPWLLFFNAI